MAAFLPVTGIKAKYEKGCNFLPFYLLNHVIHLLVHQNHLFLEWGNDC